MEALVAEVEEDPVYVAVALALRQEAEVRWRGRAVSRERDAADHGEAHACAGEDARCGPRWPGATSPFPAVAEIDHVLGKRVTFREARALRGGGSDHFPVVVSVRVPR